MIGDRGFSDKAHKKGCVVKVDFSSLFPRSAVWNLDPGSTVRTDSVLVKWYILYISAKYGILRIDYNAIRWHLIFHVLQQAKCANFRDE